MPLMLLDVLRELWKRLGGGDNERRIEMSCKWWWWWLWCINSATKSDGANLSKRPLEASHPGGFGGSKTHKNHRVQRTMAAFGSTTTTRAHKVDLRVFCNVVRPSRMLLVKLAPRRLTVCVSGDSRRRLAKQMNPLNLMTGRHLFGWSTVFGFAAQAKSKAWRPQATFGPANFAPPQFN